MPNARPTRKSQIYLILLHPGSLQPGWHPFDCCTRSCGPNFAHSCTTGTISSKLGGTRRSAICFAIRSGTRSSDVNCNFFAISSLSGRTICSTKRFVDAFPRREPQRELDRPTARRYRAGGDHYNINSVRGPILYCNSWLIIRQGQTCNCNLILFFSTGRPLVLLCN